MEHYKRCIELEGKNKLKALNNIGSLYLKNNKPKISLEYFLKAFEINTKDKIIVNNLLLNYINLRNEKKSEELFLLSEKIETANITNVKIKNYWIFQAQILENTLLTKKFLNMLELICKNIYINLKKKFFIKCLIIR